MKKKILISTGGSGGHVIPAMAFYDHLKENFDVFLVLDQRGSSFINEKQYKYKIISISEDTYFISTFANFSWEPASIQAKQSTIAVLAARIASSG